MPAGPLPKIATGKLSKSMLSKFFNIINHHVLKYQIKFLFFFNFVFLERKESKSNFIKNKTGNDKKIFL
jgi:hypothetical protein